MRPKFRNSAIALTIALAAGLGGLQAVADGSLSALPNVGSSQAFAAAQKFSMLGGGLPPGSATNVKGQAAPHDQSGTLTINRTASDSVHLTASDGLDALDQTLHVDAQGSIAQASPASPFIDALDTFAAIVAAAPAAVQKDAKWSVTVPAPLWLSSIGGLPKSMSSVPVAVTVVSATGNSVNLHGEGKSQFEMATGLGKETFQLSVAVDCTLRSGHVNSCSRTTSMPFGIGPAKYDLGETTTLSAK